MDDPRVGSYVLSTLLFGYGEIFLNVCKWNIYEIGSSDLHFSTKVSFVDFFFFKTRDCQLWSLSCVRVLRTFFCFELKFKRKFPRFELDFLRYVCIFMDYGNLKKKIANTNLLKTIGYILVPSTVLKNHNSFHYKLEN